MSYIERNFPAFPFKGEFYEKRDTKNENGDLIHVETEEVVVLRTRCDIQKASGQFQSGTITSRFNIYFPFKKGKGLDIRRGMLFRSDMYGMPVSGIVDEVVPSQMGGCLVHLKEIDT